MSKKRSTKTVTSTEVNNKSDKSPYVNKDHPKLNISLNIRENIPFTDKQKKLFSIIQNKSTKMVLIKGCAGTSKTLSAVYCGLHELNNKKFNEITYIRAAVESAENKLGMLPGEIEDKVGPYIIPLMEKLDEFLAESQVKHLINNGYVNGAPVSFLRGRHMANKYIIVDEAQSLSEKELITIITRMGEFSKIIICADPMQSDLPSTKAGAFEKFFNLFTDQDSIDNGIHTFEFTTDDIVRSKFVKFIIDKLEVYKKQGNNWSPGK